MAVTVPRLYTLGEAVEALGNTVSERTLRREIDRGNLRARRVGRWLRIVDEDLVAWAKGRPVEEAS